LNISTCSIDAMPFPTHCSFTERVYKIFLLASAFGCVVLPVILTTFTAIFLPLPVLICVVLIELVLAVIPLGSPPLLLERFVSDACKAAIEWLSIKVIYEKDKFTSPGPYVIGTRPPGCARHAKYCTPITREHMRVASLSSDIVHNHWSYLGTLVRGPHLCRAGATLRVACGSTCYHEHPFWCSTGTLQQLPQSSNFSSLFCAVREACVVVAEHQTSHEADVRAPAATRQNSLCHTRRGPGMSIYGSRPRNCLP
jgi:hypothetical protein